MFTMRQIAGAAVPLAAAFAALAGDGDLESRVRHGFADSNGVKIHYAALGPETAPAAGKKAPLVVMVHGFPDYWYTWRHQMEVLAADHEVVAIDQRGYNRSDRPKGVENYDIALLVGDVAAVIRHFGRERAIVVGHDWGGAVAWAMAMMRPDLVHKLVVLNLPHPRGIRRELANNPVQKKNSEYARTFQKEGAEKVLTAEGLASWVKDPKAREKYVEAFRRSDFEAMLNYYKRNYPKEPYEEDKTPLIKVKAPVLLIHGLDDWALHADALKGTWEWLDSDLTLVTVPGAGHFVQQDAADLVTRTIRSWLAR